LYIVNFSGWHYPALLPISQKQWISCNPSP
jgi:hypothetical protein